MTTSIIHSIEGADELFKALDALPAKLHDKLMRGATRAAAKVIQDAVMAEAPPYVDSTMSRRYGHIRDNIKVRTKIVAGVITAQVYVTGDTFWAYIIEKGARAHFIRPKHAKDLYINGQFRGGGVTHPGIAANPFMARALDNSWVDAVEATRAYLSNKLLDVTK